MIASLRRAKSLVSIAFEILATSTVKEKGLTTQSETSNSKAICCYSTMICL